MFFRQLVMFAVFAGAVLANNLSHAVALACPFCAKAGKTLAEDFRDADEVAIGRLVSTKPVPVTDANEKDSAKLSMHRATFHVTHLIKESKRLKVDQPLSIEVNIALPVGKRFLLVAFGADMPLWAAPAELSEQSERYILAAQKLPKSGAERLLFFLPNLAENDPFIAEDAYKEFAGAPYTDVKALKGQLSRETLLQQVLAPDLSPRLRRLYVTMLGICGQPEDARKLMPLMESRGREIRLGIDAILACILTLSGEPGLKFVEAQYFQNRKAEYADTYSAIMALRFHADEEKVFSRQRIAAAMYHLLDRPELADLIIPDLARWEDWTVMDRLVRLFKEADPKTTFLRRPVATYLKMCPDPAAAQHLEELRKIDPTAVQQGEQQLKALPSKS